MEFSVSGNVLGAPEDPAIRRCWRREGGDVTQPTTIGRGSWRLRSVPQHLDRYRAEGWWADATLGQTVADGLGSMGQVGFRVRSQVRPWNGTFADVDRAARSLATELRARGVGPGSVVVSQLPNWVEAGITFWAAAYVGAVVVPIVHFYGAKEVEYIVRATEPDAVVTADRFGHNDPEHKRHTTDGRALPGVELRLEDDGEIISRGPDCCLGYTDPELTASVFDDGWYRTGDVGVLDDEGYLTITDRVSDIIIRAARTSAPRRSRSWCSASTGSPRSASSPPPTCASASGRPPSCASAPGRRSTTCGPTWRPPARPARSGPSRCTWSTSSPARRRGRCRSSACGTSCARGAWARRRSARSAAAGNNVLRALECRS
jgi:hypothetical protein